MTSISQQKKLEKERRDTLREAGLCIGCGRIPAGMNKDGSQGERCRPCADGLAMSRQYERAAKPPPPPPKRNCDWFEIGVESHLDSKAFKAYCERVYGAICKLSDMQTGSFPSIRDMKQVVGESHPMNSLLFDALDALMGEGKIVNVGGVLVSRYKPTMMPKRQATGVKHFRLADSHVPRPRLRQKA